MSDAFQPESRDVVNQTAYLTQRLRDKTIFGTETAIAAAKLIDALQAQLTKQVGYKKDYKAAYEETVSQLKAAEAERDALQAQLDGLYTTNHRQAYCIQATAGALGPNYAATIDGLPKAARHVAAQLEAAEQAAATIAVLAEAADALEPFTRLMIPEKPQGNSGAYSILHDEIRRARSAFTAIRALSEPKP